MVLSGDACFSGEGGRGMLEGGSDGLMAAKLLFDSTQALRYADMIEFKQRLGRE